MSVCIYRALPHSFIPWSGINAIYLNSPPGEGIKVVSSLLRSADNAARNHLARAAFHHIQHVGGVTPWLWDHSLPALVP